MAEIWREKGTRPDELPSPGRGVLRLVGQSPPSCSLIERLDPEDGFNYRHFRMRHMVAELVRSVETAGVRPGEKAPDFTLRTTHGADLRLSDLRGRPVLLHFVSYTCPVTRGSAVTMRRLHDRYGDRVAFVDIVVRQAHPGERHGAYTTFEAKLADARAYQREEAVAWTVAVDDLPCTVQRAYGGLAASLYLLDTGGRVFYYALWGQSPPLTVALDQLLTAGDQAAVERTVDRVPHLGAAIVVGQRGPVRGGIQSLVDLELGFPGATILMSLGWLLRPLLKPLVQRTTPVPLHTKAAVALVVLGVAAVLRAGRRCPNR